MRKPVTVSVPHQLGKQEARRRLETSLTQIRGQLAAVTTSVEDTWSGDRLSFRVVAMGQSVTGRIDVLEQVVNVEVDLPWMLAMLADKVKGKIQNQGTLLLTKK